MFRYLSQSVVVIVGIIGIIVDSAALRWTADGIQGK